MFGKSTKIESLWTAVAALALLLALFPGAGAVQAQGALAPLLLPESGEVVADHYIVVYKTDVVVANSEDNIRAAVAAQGGEVHMIYKAALNGYSAYLPAQALAAVRANPAVDYVEADAVFHLDGAGIGLEMVQTGAPWGLDRIDQRNLPLLTTYNYSYTGTGVHAYIIDSGILPTHAEFAGRASVAYDATTDGTGIDCNGHGTHVAGIIGGSIYGVAKNVILHGVRVLDCGGKGTTEIVVAGIDWVTAHRVLPAVASISPSVSTSPAIDTASTALIASGVVLAVAAGDNNLDACAYSPARVPNAITVGATTSTDARSTFSNWGTCLDIFAPGTNINSAWIDNTTDTNIIDGTGLAAAHVAGAAALYLQAHPTAAPATVRTAMVSSATLYKVTDPKTGSANRLLYSLYGGPVLATVLPAGNISDTTPTFKWTKTAGATWYRFQVLKSGAILYTSTVASSACGASTCTNTPAAVLAYSAYKWRIQAMVGGVWKTYTPYLAFTVKTPDTGPRDGFWSGYATSFRVASNMVNNFAIDIYVPSCGYYTITHSAPETISNNKFAFEGNFWADGTFNSITRTNASGKTGLNSFPIANCGYVTLSDSWSTNWQHASRPPTFYVDQGDVVYALVEPEQGLEYFTVEKVEP